ncbi:Glycoprotein 3-alpha-L-fucosyltransferase A [Holothuria leucospilota]|uniref:Fucosyltransferase n=1 Tax=Holothuria leucospilota TaxID=206669 RepID=A0A9Q1H2W2_HOLLE|nr:Glycoprotein 3-alpha-L-fucosyltransferase A [Holothuria leucospilota]
MRVMRQSDIGIIFCIGIFVSTLLLLYPFTNEETIYNPRPKEYGYLTEDLRLREMKQRLTSAQQRNPEPAPPLSENEASTPSPGSLPCDGNCHVQVQLCAFFPGRLKPGTYCCPETGCLVTFVNSKKYALQNKTDVIIFFQHGRQNQEELSRTRRPHHAWVFLTREAGPAVNIHRDAIYNWSMTYRSDSDFPIPYGVYNKKVPTISEHEMVDWTKGKTKLVAWVASNCYKTGWPRLEFVRNLSKHIEVDMYGACGDDNCTLSHRKCQYGPLVQEHKFYLALENKVCKDYITEKFWSNALKQNLVPIVYGPSRSEYEKWAPPHSFIHVNDFESMEELAKYITKLDEDDALYSEYFEWQRHGSVESFGIWQWITLDMICNIAKKYHKSINTFEMFHVEQEFWDYSCRGDIETVFYKKL